MYIIHANSQSFRRLVHMFADCPVVQDLWLRVKDYILKRFGVQVTMSKKLIIVNQIAEQKYGAVNFICLIVKQYIYAQKCLAKPLSSHEVISRIRRVESIEKYIAIKNGKLAKHNLKWKCQQDNCDQNLEQYIQSYVNNM